MSDIKETLAEMFASRVGMKADIHVEAGLYKGHYPSSLEEVKGELLGLAHPLRREGLLPVYREVEFGLFLQDEKAPLYVKVFSQRCDLSGQIPLLWVLPVGKIEKIQRRRFLRVGCLLPTEFLIFEEELAQPFAGIWRSGTILDISLGGVKLQYRSKKRLFERGTHALFMLQVNDTSFPCSGEVVWAPPKKQEDCFEVGLEFGGMSRSMEKALQIFVRQQEMSSRE